MDSIIPWEKWVALIEPYYPEGKRGRPPMGIEKMLRMYLLQCWFSLSDAGVENAMYDSYAFKKFSRIDFLSEQVPDATIIAAAKSTKNKEGKRDEEMHQTKKGNEWYFGMKMHSGCDGKNADLFMPLSVEAMRRIFEESVSVGHEGGTRV